MVFPFSPLVLVRVMFYRQSLFRAVLLTYQNSKWVSTGCVCWSDDSFWKAFGMCSDGSTCQPGSLQAPFPGCAFTGFSHGIVQNIRSQRLVCRNPRALRATACVFPFALAGPGTNLLGGSTVCYRALCHTVATSYFFLDLCSIISNLDCSALATGGSYWFFIGSEMCRGDRVCVRFRCDS